MTDDTPVLTAAIQAIYLDIITLGEKVTKQNQVHLEAVKEENRNFQNNLEARLIRFREEIEKLSDEYSSLSTIAKEQIDSHLASRYETVEQSLQSIGLPPKR